MSTKYKVVVPISGGKDSQSCLKLALQKFDKSEILGLFCDTKFEHPLTYAHVDTIRNLYGVYVDTVCMGSVIQESLKWKRFPGGGARHCTDYLKIQPTKQYIKSLAAKQGGFEVWYGMRSDESTERATRYEFKISEDLYEPHEIMPNKYPQYLGKMGIKFRLPVLDWTTQEIFTFLNGEHNPLYDEGFDRVGCFPCLASGDQWKEKAFKHDAFGESQFKKVMWLSEEIGKSVWTSQRGKWINERGQGCLICSI
jgi:3'-phosphoadenosine 5'-phosphosulfate sulfotransferase (PAPS reductase)/FAD synthetase